MSNAERWMRKWFREVGVQPALRTVAEAGTMMLGHKGCAMLNEEDDQWYAAIIGKHGPAMWAPVSEGDARLLCVMGWA